MAVTHMGSTLSFERGLAELAKRVCKWHTQNPAPAALGHGVLELKITILYLQNLHETTLHHNLP